MSRSGKFFPVPENIKNHANIETNQYQKLLSQSLENPDKFWGEQAETLDWHKKWQKVKNTSFDKDNLNISWFEGGMINVAENCVDRYAKEYGEKTAILWEPDNPNEDAQKISYNTLYKRVNKCANILIELGVKPKDTVTIYMPMIPEAVISMLACAKIGAIHSVVFGGFSSSALKDRIINCNSKVAITADEALRGTKKVPLKRNLDEALKDNDTNIEKVVVFKRTNGEINFDHKRDYWWHELEERAASEFENKYFDSEHPLFILYTSGSTGKPKGILHSSAGYLLYATHTFKNVFDYKPDDIFWCTADIGWITGHSYIVYGPLAAGATILMFEGVPTYPDASRCWQIVDKYNVSLFYTAPTALRMLMRMGDEYLNTTKRNSLRVLGTVGEPINEDAWEWYYEKIGKSKCAIVDTWWQTETGGHMITPIAAITETKPGSATVPYFGIKPQLITAEGELIEGDGSGALCIADSWPGQARTIWNDHERFIETYFTTFPGYYFSGDRAHKDEHGYYWISGRMDDVINISGHRVGTAEIETVIDSHDDIVECAVVGYPHDIKGQGVFAYVIANNHKSITEETKKEIQKMLRSNIGPFVSIDLIMQTPELPKTRSGKIMRRILRKIACKEVKSKEDIPSLGDISTLLNPDIVEILLQKNVI